MSPGKWKRPKSMSAPPTTIISTPAKSSRRPAVERLQPDGVDVQHRQRLLRRIRRGSAVATHLRVVAPPPEEAVGDSRRAPCPPRDLSDRVVVDLDLEDASRTPDDALQLRFAVEIEPVHGPEAIAQWSAEQSLPCRGADACEVRQRQSRRARPNALSQHSGESKVLQCGIQRLFDHAVEPVYLVDEENVAGGEVEQDRAERALVVDGRS